VLRRWLEGLTLLALGALGLPLALDALDTARDPHAGHWETWELQCRRTRHGCWPQARATSLRPHGFYGPEPTSQDLIDQVLSGGWKKGYVFEAPSEEAK